MFATLFSIFALMLNPSGNTGSNIVYSVSIPEPHTHIFHVEISIDFCTWDKIELWMPVWTPGSYLVRDFSRNVFDFKATTFAGEELEWRKADKNTWWVKPWGEVEISYKVYAREPGIRWSFVNEEGGHIIGPNLFMNVAGYISEFYINLPKDWNITGGLEPESRVGNQFFFGALSYDDLIDIPMLIGKFSEVEFQVGGSDHVIAFLGATDADLDQLSSDVKKLVEAYSRLMGGLPYRKYAFLVVTQSRGGGIEHANGTSLGTSGWGFANKGRYNRFLQLVSHEFFHTWNVKRIRPPELRIYGYYEKEVYFDSLWWYEGVTSYYADRMLIRAGLSWPGGYATKYAGKIARYRETPGRLKESAAEASFDAWIGLYRSDENTPNIKINYYTKGEIIGLLLDLEIAERTNGEKSLDDVLLHMWKQRKLMSCFGTEDIRAVCEKVAGGSFKELFARYVYGTEEVPFEKYLAKAGYSLVVDDWRTKNRNERGYLGIETKTSDGQVTISSVVAESPAWRGGLNYGDEIIAVDGFRIGSGSELKNRLKSYPPSRKAEFLVSRFNRIKTIPVTLAEHPVPIYKIVDADDLTDRQKAVRERWLPKPYDSDDD